MNAPVRFVDSGEPMNEGDFGYGVDWRRGFVHVLRRRGDDLYIEDIGGCCSGGMHPGAAKRVDEIVFASFDAACQARDAATMRIDETIFGFFNTLRWLHSRKREESNDRHQRQMPATDNPNTEGEHRASVR